MFDRGMAEREGGGGWLGIRLVGGPRALLQSSRTGVSGEGMDDKMFSCAVKSLSLNTIMKLIWCGV